MSEANVHLSARQRDTEPGDMRINKENFFFLPFNSDPLHYTLIHQTFVLGITEPRKDGIQHVWISHFCLDRHLRGCEHALFWVIGFSLSGLSLVASATGTPPVPSLWTSFTQAKLSFLGLLLLCVTAWFLPPPPWTPVQASALSPPRLYLIGSHSFKCCLWWEHWTWVSLNKWIHRPLDILDRRVNVYYPSSHTGLLSLLNKPYKITQPNNSVLPVS